MTMTKDEAYSILSNLNEEAHSAAWDSWVAADEMSESDDEEDWAAAEDMREDASHEQAGYFRASFNDLKPEQQDAIWKFAKEDPEWAEDFRSWYGDEEFEEQIAEIE